MDEVDKTEARDTSGAVDETKALVGGHLDTVDAHTSLNG